MDASLPTSCRRHAAFALQLAAQLDPASADDVSAEIDALAARLLALRELDPQQQLLGATTAAQERIAPVAEDAGLDELLLHRALSRGSGDPLTVAIVTVEAGRRAAIPLGIVAADEEQYVAHPALALPLVADPGTPGRLVDLGGREDGFGWRSAHQVAARLLDRVEARARRAGDAGVAAAARRLRAELPSASCAAGG
jgi:DNA-binding phage protein